MERSIKAHAAAASIKGLLICVAVIMGACISLIFIRTPSLCNLLATPSLLPLPPPAPPSQAPHVADANRSQAMHTQKSDDVEESKRAEAPQTPIDDDIDEGNRVEYESRMKQVFEKASMPNRTVILTTLNGAWANEGTMINLFLESFWLGYGTQRLLKHLIFICVDEEAYERCQVIHPHCLRIKTHDVNLSQEQTLLSSNYIKLVWRRIKFLKTTLELNFDFIFTDTDVLWFRDPFPFLHKFREVDIQISSDQYNNRPWDIYNKPNTGFMYVRANERTRNFFDFWYKERNRNSSLATQGIFNMIKFSEAFKRIGMKLQFLDPKFFGGFCRHTYTDMTKSITMHATCCKGLEAKLIDLRMILDGWKKWQQLHTLDIKYPQILSANEACKNKSVVVAWKNLSHDLSPRFHVPLACLRSFKTKI